MAAATTLSTPEDQVESLMKQVAEESGMEVLDKLADNPVGTEVPGAATTLTSEEEDKLSRRYTCTCACVCVCVCVCVRACMCMCMLSDLHYQNSL